MKKRIKILFVLLFVIIMAVCSFAIAACGGNSDNPDNGGITDIGGNNPNDNDPDKGGNNPNDNDPNDNDPDKGGKEKVVPTYRGMTIAHGQQGKTAVKKSLTGNGNNGGTNNGGAENTNNGGTNNGKGNGKFKEETENEIEKPMDELVEITIVNDDEEKYYVLPNEVFIVQVHISNPNDFEIQSFTLNGKKYANYMFKEGSTMELLLLEVTAPAESGYTEYTIDAIKYIDGEAIKDVRMDGKTTIKAGIKYLTEPTARILSEKVNTTSIEISVEVVNINNLIGEKGVAVYLSDGSDNVISKDLTDGKNVVVFDNLLMGTSYKYGVVAKYDLADGENIKAHWLTQNSVVTLKAFKFTEETAIGKEDINFVIEKVGTLGSISSIRLLENDGTEVKKLIDLEGRSFDGLLSNHDYKLEVGFMYEVNETSKQDDVTILFKTLEKTAPTISTALKNIGEDFADIEITVTDGDELYRHRSIEFYKGESKILDLESAEVHVESLTAYTDYTLKISYAYDLNDGAGEQSAVKEFAFITNPHFEFTSCEIINTSAVSDGDTIYMQANIENPSEATFTHVTINGKEYQVNASSTSTYMYVEIVNEGQFAGGDTVLAVDKVKVTIDGKDYSILPEMNNSDSIFINGAIILDSIEIVNKNYETITDGVFGDYYIKLNLTNPTGYDVYAVKFSSASDYSVGNITTGTDKNIVYAPCRLNSLNNYIGIASLKYRNKYLDQELTTNIEILNVIGYSNTEPILIRTVEDLKNAYVSGNDGYYDYQTGTYVQETKNYVLANDIDLSGIEWQGKKLQGVFDGNGHKISNMSMVKTLNDKNISLGLFSSVNGTIKNLTIDNAKYFITATAEEVYLNCGIISAEGVGANFYDCKVTNSTISITLNNGGYCYVGGLVGKNAGNGYNIGNNSGCFSGIIDSCENNANITLAYKKPVASTWQKTYVGGIIGYGASVNNSVNKGSITTTILGIPAFIGGIVGETSSVKNNTNNGTITIVSGVSEKSSFCSVGGVIGGSGSSNLGNITVENCINNGKINVNANVTDKSNYVVSGIFGSKSSSGEVLIKNCDNKGTITASGLGGQLSCGGIASNYMGSSIKIDNCTNSGNLTATELSYGGSLCGISPWAASITNCTNVGNISMSVTQGVITTYTVGGTGTALKVENCTNKGNIAITSQIQASFEIGGIFSASTGNSIKNCVNYGAITVSGSGTWRVGGISARSALIESCTNNGDIKVIASAKIDTNAYLGGISSEATSVVDCKNNGNIDVSVLGTEPAKTCLVGGIVGFGERIKGCDNSGTITISGLETCCVGGIGGGSSEMRVNRSTTIENCNNSGSMTITSVFCFVGGIWGNAPTTTTIKNCKNDGDIITTSNENGSSAACGIAYRATAIENCMNNGNITATGTREVDGICTDGEQINCTNTGTIDKIVSDNNSNND